jgi:prepilin-type N-terminal cleavage/methylation domain-containing protein
MIRRQDGFTLTELLITMVIFVFAIGAITNVFVPLITQFKQHSKIAETQIEGAVGLEILRKDLEQAGFGLPWVIPSAVSYSEGSGTTSGSVPTPDTYNDASTNPPRPFVTGSTITGLGGSDYLVIKATSITANNAVMKWTEVVGGAGGAYTVKIWGSPLEDLNTGDRIIVLIPSRGTTNQRILVNSGTSFYTQFDATNIPAGFVPTTQNDIYLIYGVDSTNNLRMPFNRADYYISRGTGTSIPPRCAAGTGILMKSIIDQTNGNRSAGTPLLDCVADFHVIFRLDRNLDGTIESVSDILTDPSSGANLTARDIRQQVKEVRVYILAHEGQKDSNYTYPNSTIDIPDSTDPGAGAKRTFNFTSSGITDWQHYRWKLYRIVVKPGNLGV